METKPEAIKGHLEKCRDPVASQPDTVRIPGVGGDDREVVRGQMGFFDLSQRYVGLDAKADPLVQLNAIVP